jgi:hypothetical protein
MGMTENRRSEAHNAPASAKATLFELQVEQHHHDENYHREIARLSLHQRLNHMALHFAKYAGRIASAERISDTLPVYVDTLIIAISTTNILNEEIWRLLGFESEYPGLMAFGRALAHRSSLALDDKVELLRETCIAAGLVATACERIDHLEEISFRGEIKAGVKQLATLAIAILAAHGIDPALAIRERLDSVKSRLRLHGRV